jgi:antitoxin HicB
MVIGSYIDDGRRLPVPGKARGRKYRLVRIPALQEAKAMLYSAFLEAGIRKSDFARRLGISKTNVDRLFDFRHHSRLDQIEAAFASLGKKINIEVRDAA